MNAFETVIRLQLGRYSPAEAQRKHVEIARRGLGQFLAKQTTRPNVRIETDGQVSSTEETVKPFGVITYRFFRMQEIVTFALNTARELSPVDSGRYKASWFPIVNGAEIGLADISTSAEVTVTNDQPYARKIHVGARGFEVHAGIVEKVRQRVQRKYGALVEANIEFIGLKGGWVLRKGLRKVHRGRRYGGIRNDAGAGTNVTYPALRITPKFPRS